MGTREGIAIGWDDEEYPGRSRLLPAIATGDACVVEDDSGTVDEDAPVCDTEPDIVGRVEDVEPPRAAGDVTIGGNKKPEDPLLKIRDD